MLVAVEAPILLNNPDARIDFWKRVKADPGDFVHASRVPKDAPFGDPTEMESAKFRALYHHVHRCQAKADRKQIPPESRWEYHQPAVSRGQREYRAAKMQKRLDQVERGRFGHPHDVAG